MIAIEIHILTVVFYGWWKPIRRGSSPTGSAGWWAPSSRSGSSSSARRPLGVVQVAPSPSSSSTSTIALHIVQTFWFGVPDTVNDGRHPMVFTIGVNAVRARRRPRCSSSLATRRADWPWLWHCSVFEAYAAVYTVFWVLHACNLRGLVIHGSTSAHTPRRRQRSGLTFLTFCA